MSTDSTVVVLQSRASLVPDPTRLVEERSPLRDWFGGHPGSHVILLCLDPTGARPNVDSFVDTPSDSVSSFDAVAARMGLPRRVESWRRTTLGRLIVSVSPLDPGRAMWRRATRSRAALELIRSADLLVAADTDAIATAARALRRGWVARSVYDPHAIEAVREFERGSSRT